MRPRLYYSVPATDYRGNVSRSRAVRLACSPPAAPAPSPTSTPGATSAPAPAPTPTATAKPTQAPAPTPAPSTPSTAPSTVPGGSAVSEEVVRLTNAERQKGGCAPLVSDPQLRSAAQGHSADMAAKNYFDHTSPDGRDLTARIKASGFSPIRA